MTDHIVEFLAAFCIAFVMLTGPKPPTKPS